MAKQKSIKDRRNDQVYDLQYSRKLPLDEDGIELTVQGSRPLHSIVSPSTLPTYTETSYNPKKGPFKSKEVRAQADETILRSAQRNQMRLGAHMVTGRQPKPSKNSSSIGGECCAPMMSTKRGY